MTWNVLFFFSFTSVGPLRDCIFPSTRNHECTCQIFEGETMTGSLASTSFSFMPRESDVTRNGGSPSGRFRTDSFSRRGGTPSAPSCSLLALVVRTGRPTDCPTTWPRAEKERDSAATAREPARDAFQCKYLSPRGHGVIVAISCFSEIQPARLTSSPLFSTILSA